jgi:hypothetical protein
MAEITYNKAKAKSYKIFLTALPALQHNKFLSIGDNGSGRKLL